MPISSSLLYGEMAASGLINVAFAIFGGFLVSLLSQMMEMTEVVRSLILLAFIVGMSTAIQYGLFVALQANSCGKVTNYGAIAKATGQGAVITAIMVAIPLFVQPMRLIVSEALAQLGIGSGHQVPLDPAMAFAQKQIKQAAENIAAYAVKGPSLLSTSINPLEGMITNSLPSAHSESDKPTTSESVNSDEEENTIMVGGALNPQQFQDQTNREKYIGAAFWAAFAGAYGIGLGSLHAGTCKAV
jgi:hypothetical protein